MKVMVVEDDSDLMSLYKEDFQEINVEADFFSNGREASEAYKRNPHYDLVITDVKMPTKSGEGLIFDIHLVNPAQKILAITGHAGDLNLPSDFKVKVVEKPIGLIEALREHLPPQVMSSSE